MPKFMSGVINLRGEVLPVIDMRLKFGMTEISVTKNTCILVLEIVTGRETTKVGILVDSVNEVIEVEKEEIKNAPSIGGKYKSEFIAGLIENNDKFTMLLDINKVFSTDEIINLNEINKSI